jgi:uncharacterized repeat protein (TIGR03803 family)
VWVTKSSVNIGGRLDGSGTTLDLSQFRQGDSAISKERPYRLTQLSHNANERKESAMIPPTTPRKGPGIQINECRAAQTAMLLLLWLAPGFAPAQTYKILHAFTATDGDGPDARLVLSDRTLYGTTVQGGITSVYYPNGAGTVFAINTNGSGFVVLKEFNRDDGAFPSAGLVLLGTTLYGTTM